MKAQVSLEYFVIVAVAIIALAPLLAYANQALSSSQQELKVSSARNAVERIAEAIDWVNTQGAPARTTITVLIPDNINRSVIINRTIQFTLRTSGGLVDIYKDTTASLNGTLPNTPGYSRVRIEAFSNFVNISVVK